MMSLLLNPMLERKEPTRIALMISEDMGIELARVLNIQGNELETDQLKLLRVQPYFHPQLATSLISLHTCTAIAPQTLSGASIQ